MSPEQKPTPWEDWAAKRADPAKVARMMAHIDAQVAMLPNRAGPAQGYVRVPAEYQMTSLDELTGRELAACRARVLEAIASVEPDTPAAQVATLALEPVAAELDARAKVYAAHANSPYWCTCGLQFRGLAAIDEHLDQPDGKTHFEVGEAYPAPFRT
jgi:hypothetical protein